LATHASGPAKIAGGVGAANLIDGALVFNQNNRTIFFTHTSQGIPGQHHRYAFATAAGRNATGYIGVRFGGAGNWHYGWLHISVGADGNGRPDSIALTPGPNTGGVVGAYNSVAGEGLYAGQIASAIPEPAEVATGLALFALGAVGVREFRKRRRAAA